MGCNGDRKYGRGVTLWMLVCISHLSLCAGCFVVAAIIKSLGGLHGETDGTAVQSTDDVSRTVCRVEG